MMTQAFHGMNGQISIRYIDKFVDKFSISKLLNKEGVIGSNQIRLTKSPM